MALRQLAAFLLALILLSWSLPAQAQFKEYAPPLSYSNAQLRGQDFSNQTLRTAEFSNANLELTNFAQADLQGAVFSTSILAEANLHGANLTNAMADQVKFTNADLSDAIFAEAILLDASFEGANIVGADFTDAILDGVQIKELCKKASGVNSQTGIATRDSLGCR
ncbi:MAG: pentapeptide repeat-containing protein [Actinomycetota bacterium]